MQRLMVHDTSTPTAGIADALGELEAFVPCRAGVQVVGAGGRIVLQEGDDRGLAADAPTSDDRLAVRLDDGANYSGVLTLSTLGSRTITAREQHLAAVAVSVLRTWLDAVSSRGLLIAERRRDRGHAFEDLLTRQLDVQRRADSPVSILVLARSLKQTDAETRHATLVELRQHLRPFDAVGVLESGEVAIWLTGVGPEHAALVRERLREALQTPGLMPSLGRSPIGLAAGTIASAQPQLLIDVARADAGASTESA
jgi:hypothetical protein